MTTPRRNVELKAADPRPDRTLERALALGARDHGVLIQRDTYFAVANGRLKLREQTGAHACAELISYARPDADPSVRVSEYRLAPVDQPGPLREALSDALGVRIVVSKRRRLLIWQDVRIHLDDVEGLGRFLELEAVAPEDSGLAAEHARVETLREVLEIRDDALREGSYADALFNGSAPPPVGDLESDPAAAPSQPDAAIPDADPELLALAREAAGRAYAPYSHFPVGAAVRTEDGRRYAGANVENAAYPQGQCAEASALGAMVAGGGGRVAEVVVVTSAQKLSGPCGGCRQRLREFAPPGTPVHLANLDRVRHSTTVGELLPLAFGPETLG